MSKHSSRIRPFSNGSEFADWVERNCENCAKHNLNYPECDIDIALTESYFGDGTISKEIALRMGYLEDTCLEFEQQWYWGVIAEFEGKRKLLLGGLKSEDEAYQHCPIAYQILKQLEMKGAKFNIPLDNLNFKVDYLPTTDLGSLDFYKAFWRAGNH